MFQYFQSAVISKVSVLRVRVQVFKLDMFTVPTWSELPNEHKHIPGFIEDKNTHTGMKRNC